MSYHQPIDKLPAHTPLEEAAAAIAREDAVVFAARQIPAHDARQAGRVPLDRPDSWTRVAAHRHGRHRRHARHTAHRRHGERGRLWRHGRHVDRRQVKTEARVNDGRRRR